MDKESTHLRMNNHRSIWFLCLISYFMLTSCANLIKAQVSCDVKAKKWYQEAQIEQVYNREAAIKLLMKSSKRCPQDQNIHLLLANLLLLENRHDEAIRVLKNHLQVNGSNSSKALLQLAHTLREHFAFNEAIQNYEAFLATKPTNRHLRLDAIEHLAHAKFSKSAYAQPDDIIFEHPQQAINSPNAEYLAIMDAREQLFIFTRRTNGVEKAMFTFHESDKKQWSTPEEIQGFHQDARTAGVSISANGQNLVFAMADDRQGMGNFDIYIMSMKDGRWQAPINLGPSVNTAGWESQPCLSADGRTIYFSSNRKGGEGGNDIWKTRMLPNGQWDAPTNLGSEINGPGDEESPFIHRDQQTLYFRSNEHPGLGSFDLFMSRHIHFKNWTKPQNLGYPINSVGNDGSLFVTMDGERAFLASDINRQQVTDYRAQELMGHTDIYEFTLPEKLRPIPTTYITYRFYDAQTKEVLKPSAMLQSLSAGDTLFHGLPDDHGGIIICLPTHDRYSMSINLKGYLPYYQAFAPQNATHGHKPVQQIIYLQSIISQATQDSIKPTPVLLKNVTFKTGEATLQEAAYYELEQLRQFLIRHPDIRILIRGHTDNVGSEEDNLTLSKERAKAVYDYLIDQGVEQDRLSYQGYGEQIPITDNESESGRQQNRRTDFIVIP